MLPERSASSDRLAPGDNAGLSTRQCLDLSPLKQFYVNNYIFKFYL